MVLDWLVSHEKGAISRTILETMEKTVPLGVFTGCCYFFSQPEEARTLVHLLEYTGKGALIGATPPVAINGILYGISYSIWKGANYFHNRNSNSITVNNQTHPQ